jgi:hypothetical protein
MQGDADNLSRTVKKRRLLAVALSLALFAVYLFIYRGGFHSVDEVSMFAVTESLVKFGRVNTDQIAWTQWTTSQAEAQGFFGVDGHVYSKKGLAQSLAQAPLYGVALLLPGLGMLQTVSLLNGLVTAGTAMLLFLFLWRMDFSASVSLLTGLVYGIATIALVYAKYLFSEPLAALLLLLAAYMLFAYRQEGGRRHIIIAGLAVGAAVLTRANNLFLLPVFGLYLLWVESARLTPDRENNAPRLRHHVAALSHPEALQNIVAFVVAVAIPGAVIMGYNALRSGNPLQTGYDLTLFAPNLILGLYKLLFSPLRGFFVYSPVLLLGVPGWFLLRRRFPAESFLLLGLVGVTVLLFSAWSSGEGLSWGSRFLVPVVPFFAVCLGPVIEIGIGQTGGNHSSPNRTLQVALYVLATFSIVIQVLGAIINPWVYLAQLQAQFGGEFFLENTGALYDFRTSQIVGQLHTFGVENSDLVWWQPWGFDLPGFGLSLLLLVVTGLLAAVFYWRYDRLSSSQMLSAVAIMAFVMAGSAYFLLARYRTIDRQFGRPDDGYTQTLNEISAATPGTPIITVAEYHYHVPMNRFKARSPLVGFARQQSPPPDTAATMLEIAAREGQNWLVTRGLPPAAEDNAAEKWLITNRFKLGDEWRPDDVRKVHFATGRPAIKQAVGVTFGDEIRLTAVEYPDHAAPGQPVPAAFYFEVAGAHSPTADYNLFLQLLAADGAVAAQHDSPPGGGYVPTASWLPGQRVVSRHGLLPPDGTPAGEYRMIAGFVEPVTGERLRTSNGADFVVLGSLTIIANR